MEPISTLKVSNLKSFLESLRKILPRTQDQFRVKTTENFSKFEINIFEEYHQTLSILRIKKNNQLIAIPAATLLEKLGGLITQYHAEENAEIENSTPAEKNKHQKIREIKKNLQQTKEEIDKIAINTFKSVTNSPSLLRYWVSLLGINPFRYLGSEILRNKLIDADPDNAPILKLNAKEIVLAKDGVHSGKMKIVTEGQDVISSINQTTHISQQDQNSIATEAPTKIVEANGKATVTFTTEYRMTVVPNQTINVSILSHKEEIFDKTLHELTKEHREEAEKTYAKPSSFFNKITSFFSTISPVGKLPIRKKPKPPAEILALKKDIKKALGRINTNYVKLFELLKHLKELKSSPKKFDGLIKSLDKTTLHCLLQKIKTITLIKKAGIASLAEEVLQKFLTTLPQGTVAFAIKSETDAVIKAIKTTSGITSLNKKIHKILDKTNTNYEKIIALIEDLIQLNNFSPARFNDLIACLDITSLNRLLQKIKTIGEIKAEYDLNTHDENIMIIDNISHRANNLLQSILLTLPANTLIHTIEKDKKSAMKAIEKTVREIGKSQKAHASRQVIAKKPSILSAAPAPHHDVANNHSGFFNTTHSPAAPLSTPANAAIQSNAATKLNAVNSHTVNELCKKIAKALEKPLLPRPFRRQSEHYELLQVFWEIETLPHAQHKTLNEALTDQQKTNMVEKALVIYSFTNDPNNLNCDYDAQFDPIKRICLKTIEIFNPNHPILKEEAHHSLKTNLTQALSKEQSTEVENAIHKFASEKEMRSNSFKRMSS